MCERAAPNLAIWLSPKTISPPNKHLARLGPRPGPPSDRIALSQLLERFSHGYHAHMQTRIAVVTRLQGEMRKENKLVFDASLDRPDSLIAINASCIHNQMTLRCACQN